MAQHRRGQSMVEFALVLPVLLIVVVGLFDFGRAIYASNAIANAARTANRVAVVNQNESVIDQTAIDEAPGVSLSAADIAPTYSCTDKIEVCFATVDVEAQYDPATPLIEAIVGPITLHASSEMPIERVYVSP